ncbi:autotransporter outer membrane beta-barrel domain-containing protein [Caulobacter sp. 17J80-11]|uniref:autotransporter outer membrane beta-barrel domain-containing protein n=1 Tax=Caulobacter sp. 17J80-11 TaxID=2763502 RepID=UPI001CA3A508|nr:autotransporter outer membrane beta-barrel domain-containing protein [Caulobacter sp. 17J80-11]
MFAQSVGGGGGFGGGAGGLAGVGGGGSAGGNGGQVTVANSGSITTDGKRAHGAMAQSVGGGGGSGGGAGGVVGIGGSSDEGGDGGDVFMTNTATGEITTTDDYSYGVMAQSVGGGGGSGGFAGGLVAVGGTGSGGGAAGDVTVTNSGSVDTQGLGSIGVFAQSVGGGGGNGGGTGGMAAIGGKGAGGGAGGVVKVTNNGSISTDKDDAAGIFAQSVGGGGGNGGFAAAGGLFASVAVGGDAGRGGDGGEVTVLGTGGIETLGDRSYGVFAQSVGGGGGQGGFGVSGSVGAWGSVAVGVGGKGGAGGLGGHVTVDTRPGGGGEITTDGDNAHGIFAQSVGGGGGAGGYSVAAAVSGGIGASVSASVGVGGDGGAAGNGGVVDVYNASNVTTGGVNAHGILAQSVGGGGGDGGWSVSVAASGSDGVAVSAAAAVGGKGGAAGDGKKVTLYNTGEINTAEDGSIGVIAQSIGGGGGNGGFAASGALAFSGSVSVAPSLSLGGAGGAGGKGGEIDLDSLNDVTTWGDYAHGVVGQSIGGGGGNGGWSGSFNVAGSGSNAVALGAAVGGAGGPGSIGSLVDVTTDGTILTHGAGAMGVFAQSVGGGGGNGGFAVAGNVSGSGGNAVALGVAVGGTGGSGGIGGIVNVTNHADVGTLGEGGHAVFAQSVGGGGGNGGWSGAITVAGSSGASPVASASIGGNGGSGANSSKVTVISDGTLITEGDDAHGLFAQSVGGGGGNGGFALNGSLAVSSSTSVSLGLALGGSGAGGGIGGEVEVDSDSVIATHGDYAHAMIAQSIGGGGGNGGWSGNITGALSSTTSVSLGASIGGSAGDGGLSSLVKVTSDGQLTTDGNGSIGLLAQSIGGGGGNGGFALQGGVAAGGTNSVTGGVSVGGAGGGGGKGGQVEVLSTSRIATLGADASALVAQSIGGGGGNGGWSGAISAAAGTTNAAALTAAVGGNGGNGGDGDLVQVDSSGVLTTEGDNAFAFLAQSIGGGGGNGGMALSGSFAGLGQNSLAVGVSVGGCFSLSAVCVGGDGGEVEAFSRGGVHTLGDLSAGVVAQSIGGGGGNGGFAGTLNAALSSSKNAAVGLALGGNGGNGGNGGEVNLTTQGVVVTEGDGAAGVLAQSIGGGGGNGGGALTGSLVASGQNQVSVSAALGGCLVQEADYNENGGSIPSCAGGDAGEVTVTVENSVGTLGEGASAIIAQSIGGGGGNGGWSGALAGSLNQQRTVNLAVSLGGFGGGGGDGEAVTVVATGDEIVTVGGQSHGVLAQSIGGGGGNGGLGMSGVIGQSNSINIGVGLGGRGGKGGTGGEVNVTVSSTVTTGGDGSIGVFAQSVGGGGGAAGAGGAMALGGTQSKNVTLSLGGEGGTGATGGDVHVTTTGDVTTFGEESYAVFAQSVGGGGGHGGMAGIDKDGFDDYMAGGAASASYGANSHSLAVSLGGDGGTGGHGGDVFVTNSGMLQTAGVSASVIYAQSVGGGGGDAGVATAVAGSFGAGKGGAYAVGVGGKGGAAGDGGDVTVTNTGLLHSLEDAARGVFAQSVGGGGGAGGDARGYAMAFSTKAAGSKGQKDVTISIGGDGGAAGDGGDVLVDNDGAIVTEGDGAAGVYAQSVGGGGGVGGSVADDGDTVVDFIDNFNKSEAKAAEIAVGGKGGASGDGGDVTVLNGGVIWTKGRESYGVFAQSVGGGGGDGGSGLAGTVSIGGEGAGGGNGGVVRVTNSGAILTEGDFATGVFAQSVGGGGGIGGSVDGERDGTDAYRDGMSATMSTIGDLQAAKDFAESTQAPDLGISFGGSGGVAGDGGDVVVTNTGSIHTKGDNAFGVFAQSVGGGGGVGGLGSISTIGQVSFSGVGGNAGDGGDVTVNHSGDIVTEGYGAYGIFAQSVGGGGGVAGDMSLGIGNWGLDLGINPFAGNGGDGGDVTVNTSGNILVLGDGATAIFAQSIGGGGGLYGSEIGLGFIGSFGGDGTGGKVTVNHIGDLAAPDKNGVGALFQSKAVDGAHDIVATLNGDVLGGSVYGKAVFIDGGLNNTIDLMGAVSALSHLAILGTDGNDHINNFGSTYGNIDLDTGSNAFDNEVDASLRTLQYVDLGGGTLTNAGTLELGDTATEDGPRTAGWFAGFEVATTAAAAPSGAPAAASPLSVVGAYWSTQTTTLTGDFVQPDSGLWILDFSFGDEAADLLNVTGSAAIDGVLKVNLLSLEDDGPRTFVDAGTTAVDNGVFVADTLALDYSVVVSGNDLQLAVTPRFDDPLNRRNAKAVGDHINDGLHQGGASDDLGLLFAYLGAMSDINEYRAAFDHMSSEVHLSPMYAAYFAGEDMADAVLSCKLAHTADAPIAEGDCLWGQVVTRTLDRSPTSENWAFHDDVTQFSAGYQRSVSENWRLGVAIGVDRHDQSLERALGGAEGDFYKLGAAVKRQSGPTLVAASMAVGKGSFETWRDASTALVPGARATADVDFTFVTAELRAARLFEFGSLYLKPLADASVTQFSMDGFSERGAGGLNLVSDGDNRTIFTFAPQLEMGGDFDAGSVTVRPSLTVGLAWRPDAEFGVPASFEGLSPSTRPFVTTSTLDETMATVQASIDLIGAERWNLTLAYDGEYGQEHDRHGGRLKAAIRF